MSKRPDGALEHEVLNILWDAETALLTSEVRDRLADDLAYTSVATILTRLVAKGLLTRVPSGRGFAFQAVVNESQLTARRINDVLASTSDRRAALAGFVGGLSSRDVKALRALLEQPDL